MDPTTAALEKEHEAVLFIFFSIKSVMIVILLFQKYFIQYTWILNGIRQQAQPFLAFSLHEGQNEY